MVIPQQPAQDTKQVLCPFPVTPSAWSGNAMEGMSASSPFTEAGDTHDHISCWKEGLAFSFWSTVLFFFVSIFWAVFQAISWMKLRLAEQEGLYCLDGRLNMAVAAHLQSRDMCMAQIHENRKKHFFRIKMRTEDCLKGAEWTLKLFWTKQRK